MADEQKMVKVKLNYTVDGWNAGDVIEVPEQQAKQMTTVRQVNTGSGLKDFQVAEYADAGVELKSSTAAHQTVKDMADIGAKLGTDAPKTMTISADGIAMPKLSTTTNESIPHSTGAPMASIAAASVEAEDNSSNDESSGYDGANLLSHSRDGAKSGKQSKGAKSDQTGQQTAQESHGGGVGSKLKEAAQKISGK